MATECASLADLVLYNVEVLTAKAQDAQILPPDPMSAMTGSSPRPVEVGPHCLVEGKIEDRDGVNGRYGIRFQMRLPDDWNGRFLFQGGGGTDGFIAPAIGTIPSTGSTAPPRSNAAMPSSAWTAATPRWALGSARTSRPASTWAMLQSAR